MVWKSGHGEAVPPFSQYPVIEIPSSRRGFQQTEVHESIGIASNLGYHILQSQGWLVAFSKRAGVLWKSGHGEAVPPFPHTRLSRYRLPDGGAMIRQATRALSADRTVRMQPLAGQSCAEFVRFVNLVLKKGQLVRVVVYESFLCFFAQRRFFSIFAVIEPTPPLNDAYHGGSSFLYDSIH